MTLPDIHYRQIAYKAIIALIPVLGATLTAAGVDPITTLLVVGGLGWLGNLLADRGATQLRKDGTLILTGSVPDQVNRGIEILAQQAATTINDLSKIGKSAGGLTDVADQVSAAVRDVPVLGPLAQQAISLLP